MSVRLSGSNSQQSLQSGGENPQVVCRQPMGIETAGHVIQRDQ